MATAQNQGNQAHPAHSAFPNNAAAADMACHIINNTNVQYNLNSRIILRAKQGPHYIDGLHH
jgi:hypothetical protein